MLHYKISGAGPVVVFLHGFLESSTMWDFLPLSELQVKKVMIDLPGHGASAEIEEFPPSIEAFADQVSEVVDQLDISAYDLVGHSMGGYVALELKRKDHRVRKVVLLNSNSWADSEQKRSDRRRVAQIVYQAKDLFLKEAIPNLFRDPEKHSDEVRALIEEARLITPDGIAYASLAMAERKDLTQLVLNASDDVIIIQGEGDKIVPTEVANSQFKGKVKGFQVIPNAGHMSHIETPEAVMDIFKHTFNKKREG